MSRPKLLVELVVGQTFRRDRHTPALWWDDSLLGRVGRAYDQDEPRTADLDRIEWALWYQRRLREGAMTEDMALFRFVEATKGRHPAELPDWDHE